jgi:hypothetical protein
MERSGGSVKIFIKSKGAYNFIHIILTKLEKMEKSPKSARDGI